MVEKLSFGHQVALLTLSAVTKEKSDLFLLFRKASKVGPFWQVDRLLRDIKDVPAYLLNCWYHHVDLRPESGEKLIVVAARNCWILYLTRNLLPAAFRPIFMQHFFLCFSQKQRTIWANSCFLSNFKQRALFLMSALSLFTWAHTNVDGAIALKILFYWDFGLCRKYLWVKLGTRVNRGICKVAVLSQFWWHKKSV